jgi:hypothetical protein
VNIRWVRTGAIVFFLLFIVAVTWPGMTPGNRIFPLILGLPFSMVWIATWVVLSFLVLVAVDSAEGRVRRVSGSTKSEDSVPAPAPGAPKDGEGE